MSNNKHIMKVMNWIKDSLIILMITLFFFLLIDFIFTWGYGSRGVSKFYSSDPIEGRINKPEFSGNFGTVFDEFLGGVNIGTNGERLSEPIQCDNIERKVLFLGDSTTAGFEVDDDETFVSLLNKQCINTGIIGINFGVRAHDTHAVLGTYERIGYDLDHDSVVYLMTENDFFENVNPNAYSNMTRKFGRRFENVVIPPDNGFIFSIYANLRMFVGDRLSLSTFIIKIFERTLNSNTEIDTNKPKIEQVNTEVTKAFNLIKKLAVKTEAKGAKLYVIPYPKIGLPNVARDKKVALLSALIDNNIEGVLYVANIDNRVKAITNLDNKRMFDMRYRRDGHLSEYGHQIMSIALVNILK